MIRINLLPFRAKRKKENIRRQVFIFLSLFILISLALLYYNLSLAGKVTDLQAKVDQTQQELNRTMKAAKEVDRIKKDIETLEKKMEIIGQLEKDRVAPVDFLEEMSRMIVAQRMWLTALNEGDNTVSLNGIALDNKTVAVFMTRLEQSSLFASVNLNRLQHTKMKEVELKDFNITCVKAKPQ